MSSLKRMLLLSLCLLLSTPTTLSNGKFADVPHRLVVCAIPKCGSTVWDKFFLDLNNIHWGPQEPHKLIERAVEHKRSPSFAALSELQKDQAMNSTNWTRITVVRHPLDRIYSTFEYWCVDRFPGQCPITDYRPTFSELLKHIEHEGTTEASFLPQTTFCNFDDSSNLEVWSIHDIADMDSGVIAAELEAKGLPHSLAEKYFGKKIRLGELFVENQTEVCSRTTLDDLRIVDNFWASDLIAFKLNRTVDRYRTLCGTVPPRRIIQGDEVDVDAPRVAQALDQ